MADLYHTNLVDTLTIQVLFTDWNGTTHDPATGEPFDIGDVEDPHKWMLIFDATLTQTTYGDPLLPDVVVSAGASSCHPIKIKATSIEGDRAHGATLTIHPELSCTCVYKLLFDQQSDFNLVTAAILATINVPPVLAPIIGEGEFPKGILQCLTQVVGEQFQYLAGRPETYLVKDFTPKRLTSSLTEPIWGGGTSENNLFSIVYVESTLGFPGFGEIWVGNTLFTYSSKFSGGFRGVKPKQSWNSKKHPKVLNGQWGTPLFLQTIPVTTIVALHVPAVPPVIVNLVSD